MAHQQRVSSFALAAALVAACSVGQISEPGSSSGSGGGGNGTGVGGSSGDGGVTLPPFEPGPAGIRRLTGNQYKGSVRVLLGEAAAAVAAPPADASDNGYDTVGAAKFALSAAQVTELDDSARAIANVVVTDNAIYNSIVPCQPTGPADAACQQQFIESFGRLAWRRPLTPAEVQQALDIAQAAATHPAINDFRQGTAYALNFFLTSPYFVYIVEVGEDDPANPGKRRLTNYELASRMAFFLQEHTPDKATLDFVVSSGLDTQDEIETLATQMIASPDAKLALTGFYDEIYALRELTAVSKDATMFPQFTATLVTAMREETHRLIDDVVWTRNADARELFTANYTFVNSELSGLYETGQAVSDWTKVTLPAEQKRSGILGHASFLAKFAHPSETSPTKRGLFLRHFVLCDTIKPPPPGVVTEIPPDPGTPMTLKQKLMELHEKDPSCATCHLKMDPIGFALENYDPVGAYRTAEPNGLPIDPTASIPDLGDFASAAELGAILAEDPRVPRCMVLNLYRHSMGHMELPTEGVAILELESAFLGGGTKIQDLLFGIATHNAFRAVGAPK
jgi:hypothetical protein